mgnify:CR=1 FL=1
MVAERAYSFASRTDLDTVLLGKMLTVDQPADSRCNGCRIVQCAEGIDAYIKAKLRKPLSYIIGKAASKHHYLVVV